jgi:uncharacterized protein YndB with AHSA1/START domain
MDLRFETLLPALIEDVFDFLDDPAGTLRLNEHASEHAVGVDVIASQPDGRRTVDITMRAGDKTWTQTVEQVLRDRPTRLVSRSWTWTDDRANPTLSIITDRRLSPETDGTRLNMTIHYELASGSLVQRARLRLQQGAARLEIEHQLHFLAEHFASHDIAER